MNNNILYLGSKSKGRQKLLEFASIPFELLEQNSDECVVKAGLSFEEYVLEIAREKMRHVVLPEVQGSIFVLTADTLVETTRSKQILGKPQGPQDAKRMLRILRGEPARVVSACVLEKKSWDGEKWQIVAKSELCADATIEFYLEEELLDEYLKKQPHALNACSGGVVEGYGQSFLKSISGSYSTVLGLPIFELRQELARLGF